MKPAIYLLVGALLGLVCGELFEMKEEENEVIEGNVLHLGMAMKSTAIISSHEEIAPDLLESHLTSIQHFSTMYEGKANYGYCQELADTLYDKTLKYTKQNKSMEEQPIQPPRD